MILDRQATEEYLKSGDLRGLFNEMGWDNPDSKQPESIDLDEQKFSLLPIAEKRGVVVYQCDTIPDGKLRKKIEREIRKITHEHLVVFTLPDNSKQVWQWVVRRKGESEKFREHTWHANNSLEPLIQKLDRISFSLSDEEVLTFFGTTQHLQSAFGQENVTKRFYESFKKEHKKFLSFVEGLAKIADRKWYASLMLNRLMFVYFIQKRGFLDKDIDYLKNRFDKVRKTQGRDRFHNFYRAFLLRLFHGGLATPVELRDKETVRLIGNIPYLNGGLFEPHAFEEGDSKIQIPDEAFEAIFSFFDRYQWALDTRLIEGADGNQINPDVLGHIFEKYINQKEMGAYYTKEDITGYITQSTIIPCLLKKVESVDGDAFALDGFVWGLLRGNPDRYIYKEVAHGTESDLPEHIAAGIKDASKRGSCWNSEATGHGLPTEIWRETVARRQRYSDIQQKMASGSITKIEDLITYNLNISQFVQDVIRESESPYFIRAFWDGVKSIKVIDPACGSGAFLFAALKVLHDVYDACLDRMEQLVETASETKESSDWYVAYFQEILEHVKLHPNRSYFIYKEIILYNLYGVDIMNEAVEICKLRLFLKLASELKLEQKQKIEALPDIDFNIRAGNSLIGYTSPNDMEKAIEIEEGKLRLDDRAAEIRETTQNLAKSFASFRKKQVELDGRIEAKDKMELRDELRRVVNMLDRFLAQDYKVKIKVGEDLELNKDFQDWRRRIQPFHWWVEFYDIVDGNGFDAIIGNPPYLEASAVDYSPRGFKTERTIQGYFVEQSDRILSRKGCMSMIVPIALVSTKRMKKVQDIIENNRSAWYSNFSRRPGKLFEGASPKLTIFISLPSSQKKVFTTGYKMWATKTRKTLMPTLTYVEVPEFSRKSFWIPKFQKPLEAKIFDKVTNQKLSVGEILGDGPGAIYYRNTGVGYYFLFTNLQPRFLIDGSEGISSTQQRVSVKRKYNPVTVVALLSSSVFWWWYTIRGDCWHLTKSDIQSFRTNPSIFDDDDLIKLGQEYLADIQTNSYMHKSRYKGTGTTQTQLFKIIESKSIIDKIDAALSSHYGFTAEELDFIQNYDIKFRAGASKNDQN